MDNYNSYIQKNGIWCQVGGPDVNLNNYAKNNELAEVAISGNYNDLNNKPTLFSGDYNDLTNKPELPTGESGEVLYDNTLTDTAYIYDNPIDLGNIFANAQIGDVYHISIMGTISIPSSSRFYIGAQNGVLIYNASSNDKTINGIEAYCTVRSVSETKEITANCIIPWFISSGDLVYSFNCGTINEANSTSCYIRANRDVSQNNTIAKGTRIIIKKI